MPAMPRVKNSKATKIAFSILGVPANLKFKRSKAQEYVNQQLIAQETTRVK
jgi:hypothetical protein